MSGELGSIGAVWRYPVKSMLGEELDVCALSERGPEGDRALALYDPATERVVSAKRPKHYGAVLTCRARYDGSEVRITLPDGEEVAGGDADAAQRISAVVGRPLELIRAAQEGSSYEMIWPEIDGLVSDEFVAQTTIAGDDPDGRLTAPPMAFAAPPGSLVDVSPIHLLTTSTLARLQRENPGASFDVRRYRPNLVIDDGDGGDGFVENGWNGRRLSVGDEVVLEVLLPTPRCIMTTLAHDDVPADPSVLRTVAQLNRQELPGFGRFACAGAYASVVQGGTVRRGDRVELLA